MKKVIGIGNALVDVLVQLNDEAILSQYQLPKGGMQLIDFATAQQLGKQLESLPKSFVSGGSAANTICGLASLGVDTAFVGKVCNDEYGKQYTQNLVSWGVKSLMIEGNNMSGFCTALISPDGERTMATFLGAAAELKDIEINDDIFSGYDILHVEGYLLQNHTLMKTILQKAKNNGLEIALDMASFNVVEDNLEFLQQIVNEYVDIVFANEDEAFAYTKLNPMDALNCIAQQCKIAVVKVGAKGSLVQENDKIVSLEAFPAQRIDTTGAGDLYATGFLYGYVANFDLERSAKIASYISSMSVEVIGTKFTEQQWKQIIDTINQF